METTELFVYGTLRFPEVLEILIGRVPELTPASARGWRVRALPGLVYPGLVADPQGVADGLLIAGLTGAERAVLDAYEDDLYELRRLPLDNGREAPAYVWKDATEQYEWDPGRFAARELTGYVEGRRAWRRRYDDRRPG